MYRKRRLGHEPLEVRQLLAAEFLGDYCVNELPTRDAITAQSVIQERQFQPAQFQPAQFQPAQFQPAQGESLGGDTRGMDANVQPVRNLIAEARSADLIQEVGNKLYVVSQPLLYPNSLFVFERAVDGALEEIAEVPLDFWADEMFVIDGQVLLVGRNSSYHVEYFNEEFDVNREGVNAAIDNLLSPTLHSRNGGELNLGGLGEIREQLRRPISNVIGQIHLPWHGGDQTTAALVSFGDQVSVQRSAFAGTPIAVHQVGDKIALLTSQTENIIAIFPPPAISETLHLLQVKPDGLQEIATAQVDFSGKDYGFSHFDGEHVYVARKLYLGQNDDGYPLPSTVLSRYSLQDGELLQDTRIDFGTGLIRDFAVVEDASGNADIAAVVIRSGPRNAPSVQVELLNLNGAVVTNDATVTIDGLSSAEIVFSSPDQIVLRGIGDNDLHIINLGNDVGDRLRTVEISDHLNPQSFLQVDSTRLVIWSQSEDSDADRARFLSLTTDPTINAVLQTIDVTSAEVVSTTSQRLLRVPFESLLSIDQEQSRFAFYMIDPADGHAPKLVHGHLNADGEFVRDGSIPLGIWVETDANSERLIVRQPGVIVQYDWIGGDPVSTQLDSRTPSIPAYVAVDDYFTLTPDGQDHVLNVFANDRSSSDVKLVELIDAPEGVEIINGNRIRIDASALVDVPRLRFQYVSSDGASQSTAAVNIDVAHEETGDPLVELGLRAVDANGNVLAEVLEGDEFWLEFNATDLRQLAKGVFAAFLDLVVPTDQVVLTGEVESGTGYTLLRGAEIERGEIDELGALGSVASPDELDPQTLLRIGVRAVGAGEVTLTPEPADEIQSETLLRGIDDVIARSRVTYTPLTINILAVAELDETQPDDTNGDGEVTPADALQVLNFLSEFGSTSIDAVPTRLNAAAGESSFMTTAKMKALDVDGSGVVTPGDALQVLNKLATIASSRQLALGESLLSDDDEDERGYDEVNPRLF
ncbi:MAG: dockerin type I domain-containing protein [Pirellulaceae bacterium]